MHGYLLMYCVYNPLCISLHWWIHLHPLENKKPLEGQSRISLAMLPKCCASDVFLLFVCGLAVGLFWFAERVFLPVGRDRYSCSECGPACAVAGISEQGPPLLQQRCSELFFLTGKEVHRSHVTAWPPLVFCRGKLAPFGDNKMLKYKFEPHALRILKKTSPSASWSHHMNSP